MADSSQQQKPEASDPTNVVSPVRVRTSANTLEAFQREKISNSLMKEAKLDEPLALMIAQEIETEVRRLNLSFLSAPLLREMVNVKLLEHGFEAARNRYTRLGMPIADLRTLIYEGAAEFPKAQHNPENVHKLMANVMAREYAYLSLLPQSLVDAHMSAEIHIHNLEYFGMRPFCFSHDIRFFLKNGLKVDGTGEFTAVTGPAKHPEVAFMHAAKILAASQINCAGSQGFAHFNTFLAPYVHGLPKDRIAQLAQFFVYEMCQMYVARGGQVVFSTLDLDLRVPEYLAQLPAILPGGKTGKDTYGNFEADAQKLLGAMLTVLQKGDARGKAFEFPKLNLHVSDKDFKTDLIEQALDVALTRSGVYFAPEQKYLPERYTYQGTTHLVPLDPLGNELENGLLRSGAVQLVSINLPKIAYDAKDETAALDLLRARAEKARDVLLLKREIMHKNLRANVLPFLNQPVDSGGTSYFQPDRHHYLVGFVGLNEAVKALTSEELHNSKSAWKVGHKLVQELSELCNTFSNESGLSFAVTRPASPFLLSRLATIDRNLYGPVRVSVAPYTDSFHIRSGSRASIETRIEREAPFHPLGSGGVVSTLTLPNNAATADARKRLREAAKAEMQFLTLQKEEVAS